jgi:hypothetical protein
MPRKKSPVTRPGTFWLVAQCLNHYTTPGVIKTDWSFRPALICQVGKETPYITTGVDTVSLTDQWVSARGIIAMIMYERTPVISPVSLLLSLHLSFQCTRLWNTQVVCFTDFRLWRYRYFIHHNRTACKVLGLVTCSGPINSREVFWGVILVFVSYMVDI